MRPDAVRAASVRRSSWRISRSPYLTIGPPTPALTFGRLSGSGAIPPHTIEGMTVARALGLVVAAGLAGAPLAGAHVLRVGPGQRYTRPCQAIAAARTGDTIEIDACGNRDYRGDVCAWSTNRLTVVGVHGRAHVDAAGASSE